MLKQFFVEYLTFTTENQEKITPKIYWTKKPNNGKKSFVVSELFEE
jgi:hypothetical protein